MEQADPTHEGRHRQVGRYWDAWFDAQPDLRAYRASLQSLLSTEELAGRRVLDLGCGTGVFSRLLLESGARQVVGLDRSARSLEAARASTPSLDLVRMDLVDAPVLGTFDVVLAYAAIYYADEPDLALAAAARCVAPGGWLIAGLLEDNPAARLLNRTRRLLERLPQRTWPWIGALAAVVTTPLAMARAGRAPSLRRRTHRAVGGLFLAVRKLYTVAEIGRVLAGTGLVIERSSPGTGLTPFSRHIVVRARRPCSP